MLENDTFMRPSSRDFETFRPDTLAESYRFRCALPESEEILAWLLTYFQLGASEVHVRECSVLWVRTFRVEKSKYLVLTCADQLSGIVDGPQIRVSGNGFA
jgi:hypothetical protein